MTAAIDIHIRIAGREDAAALRRLGELEGRPMPAGEVLVAEAGGRVLAALPMSGGPALADPFAPTSHLAAQLEATRTHLLGGPSRHRRLRRRGVWRRLISGSGRGAPRAAGAPSVPGSGSLLIR